MTLTNEQKLAFTVFGMLLMFDTETLEAHMSVKKLTALCADVEKYINPLVSSDIDLISPSISVLESLIKELKKD